MLGKFRSVEIQASAHVDAPEHIGKPSLRIDVVSMSFCLRSSGSDGKSSKRMMLKNGYSKIA
jgi:hypothetical protein